MRQLAIRPLEPGDLDGVRAMLGRLSCQSRYRRFLSTTPAGPEWELSYLSRLRPGVGLALVAEESDDCDGSRQETDTADRNRLVGLARYHRTTDDHAEVAVAVEDDRQGRGIGRALMGELSRRAHGDGLTALDVTILTDNLPALRLVHGMAPTRVRLQLVHGLLEGSIPLAG